MSDDVHLIREIRPGHRTIVACGAPATFGKPRRHSLWVGPSGPSRSLFVTCPACLAWEGPWAVAKDADAPGHPVKPGSKARRKTPAVVSGCPACVDGLDDACENGCGCVCHHPT